MFVLSAAFLLGSPIPAWYDQSLAGYRLAYDVGHSMVGIYDPKRNYYLLRTVECDGAIVTLTLTRDRNAVAEMGYTVPNFKPKRASEGGLKLLQKSLPSLTSGRGVSIGMTETTVRSLLGAPVRTKTHDPYRDLVYQWHRGKGTPVEEKQRYTFKADRLIEVEFDHDASP